MGGWGFDRASYLAELRLSFGFGLPHRVMKPLWRRCEGREAYWIRRAWWAAGADRPLELLRCIRHAAGAAFLTEWHRALGTTYETTEGGRNALAVITGLTA